MKKEWQRGEFLISTDKRKLQLPVIQGFLSNDSYWAQGIPTERVRKTLRHCHCFGLYLGKRQIGFCRVVTDYVRFAWLSDVFVLAEFRGLGLSKWLMEVVNDCPDFRGIRRWILATKDAHGLYEQFGFGPLEEPDMFMEKKFSGDW